MPPRTWQLARCRPAHSRLPRPLQAGARAPPRSTPREAPRTVRALSLWDVRASAAGGRRQRCRCLWGSRRCQLPFPGLATAGPLPPLLAAAGPARAPAAAPRWAGGPAAASSKLSCPAVRPSGHPPQRPALRSALPKPPRAWPSPVLQGLGRDSATVSSSLPGGGVQAASTPVCSHPSAQQVRRLQM